MKKHLLQKDWLWQYIFLTMFMQRRGLLLSDLQEKSYDVTVCLKFGDSTDDLDNIWNLAEEVDSGYENMALGIDIIRYYKPIPWQYDFVTLVSRICKVAIEQTLALDSIVTAYCWLMAWPNNAIEALLDSLDLRYKTIFDSIKEKESKLKRNLLLTLECMYGRKLTASIDSYKFRDILDEYINTAGFDGFLQALNVAKTSETQLLEDEHKCLAFAYYSPYFDDKVNLARNFLPQSSLFANVHEYMHAVYNVWKADKQNAAECEDYEPLTEASVYVDPSEMCIINVHADEQFFANVYIKRLKVGCLLDSCPDFLVYNRKFLYTVEFVDDFSEVPAAAKFVKMIADLRNGLNKVSRQLENMPQEPSAERSKYLQKRNDFYRIVKNSYLVSPFE